MESVLVFLNLKVQCGCEYVCVCASVCECGCGRCGSRVQQSLVAVMKDFLTSSYEYKNILVDQMALVLRQPHSNQVRFLTPSASASAS